MMTDLINLSLFSVRSSPSYRLLKMLDFLIICRRPAGKEQTNRALSWMVLGNSQYIHLFSRDISFLYALLFMDLYWLPY